VVMALATANSILLQALLSIVQATFTLPTGVIIVFRSLMVTATSSPSGKIRVPATANLILLALPSMALAMSTSRILAIIVF
jgi:hypothetical protein